VISIFEKGCEGYPAGGMLHELRLVAGILISDENLKV
jgi:hypothetical protein